MNKSQVDVVHRRAEEVKAERLKVAKQRENISELINTLAKTESGRTWLKSVYEMSKLGMVNADINPNMLVRDAALKEFYIRSFRVFFSADTLKMVEANNYCVDENDLIEEK